MPYLSGDVVYSLRCSLLHEGNPNIDNEKQNINKFSLVIEKKNEWEIYGDSSSISEQKYNDKTYKTREYRVNIRRLCKILCWCTEEYYNDNKEKFNFFNYSIIDWDKEIERLK